jgi:hypothetical protein
MLEHSSHVPEDDGFSLAPLEYSFDEALSEIRGASSDAERDALWESLGGRVDRQECSIRILGSLVEAVSASLLPREDELIAGIFARLGAARDRTSISLLLQKLMTADAPALGRETVQAAVRWGRGAEVVDLFVVRPAEAGSALSSGPATSLLNNLVQARDFERVRAFVALLDSRENIAPRAAVLSDAKRLLSTDSSRKEPEFPLELREGPALRVAKFSIVEQMQVGDVLVPKRLGVTAVGTNATGAGLTFELRCVIPPERLAASCGSQLFVPYQFSYSGLTLGHLLVEFNQAGGKALSARSTEADLPLPPRVSRLLDELPAVSAGMRSVSQAVTPAGRLNALLNTQHEAGTLLSKLNALLDVCPNVLHEVKLPLRMRVIDRLTREFRNERYRDRAAGNSLDAFEALLESEHERCTLRAVSALLREDRHKVWRASIHFTFGRLREAANENSPADTVIATQRWTQWVIGHIAELKADGTPAVMCHRLAHEAHTMLAGLKHPPASLGRRRVHAFQSALALWSGSYEEYRDLRELLAAHASTPGIVAATRALIESEPRHKRGIIGSLRAAWRIEQLSDADTSFSILGFNLDFRFGREHGEFDLLLKVEGAGKAGFAPGYYAVEVKSSLGAKDILDLYPLLDQVEKRTRQRERQSHALQHANAELGLACRTLTVLYGPSVTLPEKVVFDSAFKGLVLPVRGDFLPAEASIERGALAERPPPLEILAQSRTIGFFALLGRERANGEASRTKGPAE